MAGNYVYEITIPANTTETVPQKEELILSSGLIDQISIMFPPGCSALAHIQIYEQESKLFPVSIGGSYAWDGIVLQFNPQYYLRDEKPILVAKCWNDDEYNEHTITLMINIGQIREEYQTILARLKMIVGF